MSNLCSPDAEQRITRVETRLDGLEEIVREFRSEMRVLIHEAREEVRAFRAEVKADHQRLLERLETETEDRETEDSRIVQRLEVMERRETERGARTRLLIWVASGVLLPFLVAAAPVIVEHHWRAPADVGRGQ